jgi:hypothetical protein
MNDMDSWTGEITEMTNRTVTDSSLWEVLATVDIPLVIELRLTTHPNLEPTHNFYLDANQTERLANQLALWLDALHFAGHCGCGKHPPPPKT